MNGPGRYATSTVLTMTGTDGRTISYLDRRFLPQPGALSTAGALQVSAGQRDDLIAAVTLGDATMSWLLADTNAVQRPSELGRPGRTISIPASGQLPIPAGGYGAR